VQRGSAPPSSRPFHQTRPARRVAKSCRALMACPTRQSPSARCSPPRRRAAPSAARCRALLVIVVKPSWSLYRRRARGRERVRPNERAVAKDTTTAGIGGLASESGPSLAVLEGRPNERCPRRTSRSSAAITRSAAARAASAARSAWTTGAGSTRGRGSRSYGGAGRSAVLRHRRTVARTTVVERRRTRAAAPPRRRAERPAALCAASAPARHPVELAHEGVPLNVIQRQLGHANLGTTSQGRDGARCRRYRRSVSPTRPPNRTCPFLSIRLSTGHGVADRDAGLGNGGFRPGGGSACSGVRPGRGNVVTPIAI
jgi:hypothetical protein